MTGFFIVLTFLAGTLQLEERELSCPDMPCVERVRVLVGKSTLLVRLRVYHAADVVKKGKMPIFGPFIDEWRQ